MVNKSEEKDKNTEKVILVAARQVFEQKGFAGSRMQEIADKAGINKALLHYYFRSKEKLFDRIFKEAFNNFWPQIEKATQDENTGIQALIAAAVNGYIDILTKMPFLSSFIVGEINRSPDRVEELMKSAGINPSMVLSIIQKSMEKGEIIEMDPRELIVNIVGLSVFPFLSRPLLSRMLWNSQEEYDDFLQKRRQTVYDFICRSILK